MGKQDGLTALDLARSQYDYYKPPPGKKWEPGARYWEYEKIVDMLTTEANVSKKRKTNVLPDRTWTLSEAGLLSLADGRQLHVDSDGWAVAHKQGVGTNTDVGGRTWTLSDAGILTLPDGRQLYVNPQGRAGLGEEGRYTNTDSNRRTWTLSDEDLLSLPDGRQLYISLGLGLVERAKEDRGGECRQQ